MMFSASLRLMGASAVIAALVLAPSAWAQSQAAPVAEAVEAEIAVEVPQEIAAEPSVVGWLELTGPLRNGPVPFAWVDEQVAGLSLERVVSELERAAASDSLKGVVISLEQPTLSLTQVLAIRDAMREVRQAGKQVMVFAQSYDLLSYLLASGADRIILQHHGELRLSGLAIEEIYLLGLFEKFGVKPDLVQVGKFKGAEETFVRKGPSEAWNQNMDSLLDDLYGQIIGQIAQGRGMTAEQFEAAMADLWTMSDQQYVERGLIDVLDGRNLYAATGKAFGEHFSWYDMSVMPEGSSQVDSPFALFQTLFQPPQRRVKRDSVAVIYARGPIHGGQSASAERTGLFFSSESIGSESMVELIDDLRHNPRIKAVVLRIDSPGGSALASEMIWQAMHALAQDKPVYVSIGAMAASGGYYIACAGEQIYVSPASIVGSIGVLAGKISLGGLYEKLGVTVHRRSRGPLGDMFNSVDGFTPEQRQAVQASAMRIYDQFTSRIREGRGERIADIDQVAHGRLFTGRMAVENGLADKVGDLDQAVQEIAAAVDLAPGQYDVVTFPEPLTLGQFLSAQFGGVHAPAATQFGANQPMLEALRQVIGPQGWQQTSDIMSGFFLLRNEPALTLMPAPVIIR